MLELEHKVLPRCKMYDLHVRQNISISEKVMRMEYSNAKL